VNRRFWLREWGATTFVLTVLIGLIVVPVALFFGHRSAVESAGNPGSAPASAASQPR
jgi:hypothetical protein